MARLFADENLPILVVTALRLLGHDIRTAHESVSAIAGCSDRAILNHASTDAPAVVTLDRRHFIRLHAESGLHFGIIVCSSDTDFESLAARINDAISLVEDLRGQLLRINRPQRLEEETR
ncbi:MAG: DUF5615 family PIN-like protein [Candidatus Hydrogenedentes bacterium]|nr:DUF5615 family PIN-like protein [Candidatus Hydrogenedentota bacterium]